MNRNWQSASEMLRHPRLAGAVIAICLLLPGCERERGAVAQTAGNAAPPDRTRGAETASHRATARGAFEESEPSAWDPSARYLILHTDDAGMCRSVNQATIEVLEAGMVSSASIMVPCPGFEEFAEYARTHPQYDYGIHLTLNAEFRDYRWGPVLPASEVPSLVDRQGYLWRSEQQTAANARTDDVERELRAQIDRALERNVPLTHLDTHMGTLFFRPDLVDVYLRLGSEYNLPVLWTRDETFLRQLRVGREVRSQLDRTADELEQRGFPVLQNVQMHYVWDSLSAKKRAYLDLIGGAGVGATQIIIHAGIANDELTSITGSVRIRDRDRRVFTDPDVAAAIRDSGIRLTTWKGLHEMASARPELAE